VSIHDYTLEESTFVCAVCGFTDLVGRCDCPNNQPARCEVRGCGAPADPRAVAVTAYACTEHAHPADLEHDTDPLTIDDLRTIHEVMTRLAADHRSKVQRLERARQISGEARSIALCHNREAVTRYERIAARVGRQILELDGEL